MRPAPNKHGDFVRKTPVERKCRRKEPRVSGRRRREGEKAEAIRVRDEPVPGRRGRAAGVTEAWAPAAGGQVVRKGAGGRRDGGGN